MLYFHLKRRFAVEKSNNGHRLRVLNALPVQYLIFLFVNCKPEAE
jgi:hypothetical protein